MSYDEEYCCPHCNATLNDQDGFDPSKGYWRCTSCGQMLIGDDVPDGETFEDVAWFCDGCGAFLNKQDGFSDSLGHWTCTSCGHKNPINEKAILDEDDSPECPSCGAKLKTQYSFSEWSNDHTCTECGTNLHRDYSSDDFEVVEEEEDEGTKCPNCGAKLEDQYSFYSYCNDHECTECGTKLHRDYSSDDFEVVDVDDEVEDDDSSSSYSGSTYYAGSSAYSRGSTISARGSYTPRYESAPERKTRKRKRFGFFWWLKFITIMPVVIIAIGFAISIVVFMVNEYKAVPVGYAEADFIDKDYNEVRLQLESGGFTNISLRELDDLPLSEEAKVGKVVNVTIEGKDDYTASTEKSKDAKIVIEYHTIKLMEAPFSSKDAKGQMHDSVVQQLTDAGFINIRIEIKYDLITGWITEEGEVESVTINGAEKYSQGDRYRPDVEVVVTYHAFKKNKTRTQTQ